MVGMRTANRTLNQKPYYIAFFGRHIVNLSFYNSFFKYFHNGIVKYLLKIKCTLNINVAIAFIFR